MVVINYITTKSCTLNVRYNILYKVSLENFSSIVTCISLIIFCMVLFIICHKVLDVVRANYDSLTLKLQDSLDQYERYSEKPRENAFFTNLVSQNLFIIKLRIFKSILLCNFPDRIVQQNDLVTLYNNRLLDTKLGNYLFFLFSINLHLLIIVKTLMVGRGGGQTCLHV